MFKKTIVLALAAIAVAAVTAPMASAVWTNDHLDTTPGQNDHVLFTGQAAFTSALIGGIECQTTATVEFTGGTTTGHIKQFEPDGVATEKCVTSGPLAPCKVTSVQPTGLPWTVHSNGADTITIKTGEIHNVLEGAQQQPQKEHSACGIVQTVTLKAGTVHATIAAGETCTTSQVHLSGQLEVSTGAKVQVHGTQGLTPSATYGTDC